MRRIRVDCDCAALARADAAAIDGLARCQLAVQREGGELRLVGAQPCLIELIDFCGLTGVLRIEAGWQAEEREEPGGVEEERDLPDPAA